MSQDRKQINDIVEHLIEELRELSDGHAISTWQLLDLAGYPPSTNEMDLFTIHSKLFRAAKKANITLDMSAHDGLAEGLPFFLDYIVTNQRAQIKCPFCGSRDTARILYGTPLMTDHLQDKLDRKKVVFGGCCLETAKVGGTTIAISPRRHCNECGKDFGTPPISVSDEHVTDYLNDVNCIEFSRHAARGLSYTTIRLERTSDGGTIRADGHFIDRIETCTVTFNQKKWDAIKDRLFNEMYLHEWPTEHPNEFIKDGETWVIMDGEAWSAEITLEDGTSRRYEGSNSFPVYWNELCRMLAPYSHTFGKKHY